ncbi:hypothetical protein BSL78_21375 [Apostichopus japonicus]|uniref:Uncharacterized protein n=1 Tax=Stichopus japonicus TaxID=307972 RepID=A0A2G8K1D8_STIJA|nr:hypothetical protein BSL78_21375 [Apostichopus japonicus]
MFEWDAGVRNQDSEFADLDNECEETYTTLLEEKQASRSDLSDKKGQVEQKLEERKRGLAERSRTSKLWLTYMKMVKVARMLILADRLGSWSRGLSAVGECLPTFGAAGHFNYLKSAYMYLQNMSNLETRNPEVFQKFQEGFHVIHRTDQCCAGLGADLVTSPDFNHHAFTTSEQHKDKYRSKNDQRQFRLKEA